jgi:hypothetical protein
MLPQPLGVKEPLPLLTLGLSLLAAEPSESEDPDL